MLPLMWSQPQRREPPAPGHAALLGTPLDGGAGVVRCDLCEHRCVLRPGQRGICGVRLNHDGALRTLAYGRAAVVRVEAIEKKPLFHFHPGSRTLALATAGCNLRCAHCQNWELSQAPVLQPESALPGEPLAPAEAAARAVAAGCTSVCFSFTEPTIFAEYVVDVARAARARDLRTVLVTNGYLTPEALALLGPWVDAANVDLKGLRDEVLRREVGGVHAPSLRAVAALRARGVWVEVTTVVVPGTNDGADELAQMARRLAAIDRDVPWHVARFHPDWLMRDRPPTPLATLRAGVAAGRAAGLRHVYVGNVWGDRDESTWCAGCGALLILRRGYAVERHGLAASGACRACGTTLAGRGL
jgi:pyruvate formate lyase activating enzyme